MTVDDSRFEPQFLISGQRGLNANNLNQYTSITGQALAYDGNGNLSSNGTYTYVHDALNRLASATKQGAANNYQYGPLDRRTAKETAGLTTSYIYAGDHAAAEYDNSGTLVRKFIYGPGIDQPLVMVRRGDSPGVEIKYYYHADALGSIAGLTNEGGAWQETYSYSAWGKLNSSSSVGNPYFYTGRRYDAETGLYYYRARYYDAYQRRFIQPDPIGFDGGMNWYAYVQNDPVNEIDPLGLMRGARRFRSSTYRNHYAELEYHSLLYQIRRIDPGYSVLRNHRRPIDWRDVNFLRRALWNARQSLTSCFFRIHDGAQGKHTPGHHNFRPGRSPLYSSVNPRQLLEGMASGRYRIIRYTPKTNRPVVNFEENIGLYNNIVSTRYGTIRFGKHGVHIVPANPIQY